jgi:mRNA interferase MazF
MVKRGDVVLVNLDPTIGSEIKKTRPCLVVSPDELNEHLSTYIVAPLTTGSHSYPYRIACRFKGKEGHIVLDQVRTIDRERVIRTVGTIGEVVILKVLHTMQEMFAP